MANKWQIRKYKGKSAFLKRSSAPSGQCRFLASDRILQYHSWTDFVQPHGYKCFKPRFSPYLQLKYLPLHFKQIEWFKLALFRAPSS
jgi:hypothetical protein